MQYNKWIDALWSEMTYEVRRRCVIVERSLDEYLSGVWFNVEVVGRWNHSSQTIDEPCLRQQHSPTFSIVIIIDSSVFGLLQ